MTGTTAAPRLAAISGESVGRAVRRNGWALALLVTLAVLLIFTRFIHPTFGGYELESLVRSALPLALAASAQAVIVICGGIDLSIGSVMALTNVVAAVLMASAGAELSVAVVAGVLLLGVLIGVVNGGLVVITRVPDIIVTLAMSFVWSGSALLVLSSPGGSAADWFRSLVSGGFLIDLVPKALIVMLVVIGIVWLPLSRTRWGISLYAVGSDRLAAYRSGVNIGRTKVLSYAVGGLFAAAGGLALTATTNLGTPVTGAYTLQAVAAIVLGGVSLAGGRGGLLGPIAAALILSTIRIDLIFLGVDANYSVVINGVIMVVVVMIGGLLTLRRTRQ